MSINCCHLTQSINIPILSPSENLFYFKLQEEKMQTYFGNVIINYYSTIVYNMRM